MVQEPSAKIVQELKHMKLKHLKQFKAVQDLAYCIGTYGRYLVCLLAVAEELTDCHIDILRVVDNMIKDKLIDYDEKRPRAYRNSLYIFDADKVLKYVGCDGYHVQKVKELPKDYKGQYIIRYTLEGDTQFALPDYIPVTYSRTCKEGRITAYYLIQKSIAL